MARFFGLLTLVFLFSNFINLKIYACSCSSPTITPDPGVYLKGCYTWTEYYPTACHKQEQCQYCFLDEDETPPKEVCTYHEPASEACMRLYNFDNPEDPEKPINKSPKRCGSVINVSSLSVGEIVPLVGTGLSLAYQSNRVSGYKADYVYRQNIDQGADFPDVQFIHITDTYLGSGSSNNHAPNAYAMHTFDWDGLDHDMLMYTSSISVDLVVKYEHVGAIYTTEYVRKVIVGGFQAKVMGFGGWTLSNVHFYDPLKEALYFGYGDTTSVKAFKVQESSGDFEIQDDSDPQNPPTFTHYMVISDDKNEAYIFNEQGFHIETRSVRSNSVIQSMTYNGFKLAKVEDNFGNEITITRTSTVVTIDAPNGKQTIINLDTNGWAKEIIDPLNNKYEMTYFPKGLIQTFKNPEGLVTSFSYDAMGKLIDDTNTAGHETTFDILSLVPNVSREISSTTKMGRATTYNITN